MLFPLRFNIFNSVSIDHVRRPDLLLSLAKDGTVRLWDVVSEECVAVCTPTQPSAVCFNVRSHAAPPKYLARAPEHVPR